MVRFIYRLNFSVGKSGAFLLSFALGITVGVLLRLENSPPITPLHNAARVYAGQASQPLQSALSETNKSAEPLYIYPTCSGLRKVNFRQLTYPLDEYGFTQGTEWLRVVNGRYEDNSNPDSMSYLYFEIRDVVFGDLTGDGKEEAAVTTIYGSNSGSFFLTDTYIFSCVAGKVNLIDIFKQSRISEDNNLNVQESVDKPIKVKNGVLLVTYGTEGSRPTPEFRTTFRYKLTKGKIIQQGHPTNRKIIHKEDK